MKVRTYLFCMDSVVSYYNFYCTAMKTALSLYRYMYLKKAWYLKTYIETNSSIDFEKLH